ncbi:SGNH hydrolase-type esterase domain-containing protein [Aspergillus californicus]
MFLLLLWILIFPWQPVSGRPILHTLLNGNKLHITSIPLRVLPLGASITWGVHSSDGNGYREPLRAQLQSAGWEVDMVGSQRHGDMEDNSLEATPGNTIDQVRTASSASLPYKPNVVLINAGTNDCRLEIDIPNAGQRMRSLISSLLDAPDMANTLIVLSTLLPSGNTVITRNTPAVNAQYRDLVQAMRKEGVSIVLADMNPEGHSLISYPADFTQDGVVDDTHPGDSGYAIMARVWYEAIVEAGGQGLLTQPVSLK